MSLYRLHQQGERVAREGRAARRSTALCLKFEREAAARVTCKHPAETQDYVPHLNISICKPCGARLREGEVVY